MAVHTHKNWLLTVAQVHAPAVFWSGFGLAVLVLLATFLFRPIYSARTMVSLDADLTKVLRNVELSYPSETSADYIRYEYFATHNVSLMRLPHLADQLVRQHDLRNRSGKPLFAEYLVQPGFFRLLFANRGQGIKVKWISDTQQFSISGLAQDPDRAVALSRDYTALFLKDNAEQFRGELLDLQQRMERKTADIQERVRELDAQIMAVRKKYQTVSLSDEYESMAGKVYDNRELLNAVNLSERTYPDRMARLKAELNDAETMRIYERVMVANPHVLTLKSELLQQTEGLLAAAVEYTAEHPVYKAAEQKVKAARDALQAELEKTFQQETEKLSSRLDTVLQTILEADLEHLSYSNKVRHYTAVLDAYAARMAELSSAEVEVDRLTAVKDALNQSLAYSVQATTDLRSILDKALPFFRVVSPASVDHADLKHYKYFPKRKKMGLLAFLAGGLLAAFIVVGRELHANTLHCCWQMDYFAQPLACADVPEAAGTPDDARVMAWIARHGQDLLAQAAEAGLVRVVGGAPDAGCTTVARALAAFLLRLGKRPVLVDGNLAGGGLSRAAAPGGPGLTDCLRRPGAPLPPLGRDPVTGAPLLAAGADPAADPSPPPAAGLAPVLDALRAQCDCVILADAPLDSPEHSLAAALPPHDVLLVLRSGAHSVFEVEPFVPGRAPAPRRAVLKGIVINRIPFLPDFFSPRGWWALARHCARWPLSLRRQRG